MDFFEKEPFRSEFHIIVLTFNKEEPMLSFYISSKVEVSWDVFL